MQEGQEPGQVIIPHAAEPAPAAPTSSAPTPLPTESAVLPAPTPAPQAPASATLPEPQPVPVAPLPQPTAVSAQPAQVVDPAPSQAPEPASDWRFSQETDPTVATRDEPLPEGITWTAAQFTAHDKGFGWYAILAFGGIVATAVIYFLTKDKITTGVIIFALLVFGIFAARKPREEQYALNAQGIQVGAKLYAFHDFKTFSVADEGNAMSVVLMPLKRFMPALTVYVTKEIEDRVVDFLSYYLPVSEHKADAVDGLLRRIRF